MIDQKIFTFLEEHHVLTLATSKDNQPYCANCFFAFDKENFRFIIASDTKSNHTREALSNPHVAGTIFLETKEVGKIQGLQFKATFHNASSEEKKLYFKTYPYALPMMPKLWSLHVKYIKFTDNRLGFGGKVEHNF